MVLGSEIACGLTRELPLPSLPTRSKRTGVSLAKQTHVSLSLWRHKCCFFALAQAILRQGLLKRWLYCGWLGCKFT